MRFILCIYFILGCGLGFISPSPAFSDTDPPTVFVSILPQKYFVQRIGGDSVIVEVMVLPGASPAIYEPKPSQMRKLASSAAYFAIGVPFEAAWLERIAGVNAKMQIVRTDAGITKLAMTGHRHEEENHGQPHDDVEHGHSGLDPHIWLSPPLVQQQAAAIRDALLKLLPLQADRIEKNYQSFMDEVDQLDRELRSTLQGKEGVQFMVFHPSWGYFAHEYGLEQVAIEVEGKTPKPSQLKELIEHAEEHAIHVVFAQPQFSLKSAETIARAIKGEVILIDPLAEDWLDNMRGVAEKLKTTLR